MPKISALPASGALAPGDILPVVTASDLVTRRATITQFQAAVGGGGGGGSVVSTSPSIIVVPSDAPQTLRTAISGSGFPWTQLTGIGDSAAINAAISEASTTSTTGGATAGKRWAKVLIAGGTVDNDAPILGRDGVWLQGMGLLTELVANGCTETAGAGAAPAQIKLASDEVQGFAVSDMLLDGNGATGGACHGVFFSSAAVTLATDDPFTNPLAGHSLTRLHIRNHIGLAARDNLNLAGTVTRGVRVSQVECINATGRNITALANDCFFSNVYCYSGEVSGIICDGTGNTFSSCRVDLAGGAATANADAFRLNGARTVASGCTAVDAGRDGFRLVGADLAVSGCLADSNGRINVGDGFRITTSGSTVYGTATNRTSTTGPQRYGFNFVSGAGNIVVGTTLRNVLAGVGGTASADSYVRIRGQVSYSVDDTMGVVAHGATAGTARPTGFPSVLWIGTVAPTNMTTSDLYLNQT
jgi:hypothetical protein